MKVRIKIYVYSYTCLVQPNYFYWTATILCTYISVLMDSKITLLLFVCIYFLSTVVILAVTLVAIFFSLTTCKNIQSLPLCKHNSSVSREVNWLCGPCTRCLRKKMFFAISLYIDASEKPLHESFWKPPRDICKVFQSFFFGVFRLYSIQEVMKTQHCCRRQYCRSRAAPLFLLTSLEDPHLPVASTLNMNPALGDPG